ncbi:MAG: hypothetical protein II669_02030 [Elusimicrobia bacterium]|nr:hypothetical protein [Elusimicrobiota bacterium]
MEKFVNCCVIYDNSGNQIDIVESKTITETAFKDLKKKVALNKKEIAQAKSDKEKELAEKEKLANAKHEKQNIMLAYLMYDELVERGTIEFNKNFESDYLKWLNEGTQLDLEKCPAQFKAILERLG